MGFIHARKTCGSTAWLVFQEIRFWLGKQGGTQHEGQHWIWKKAEELAEALGFNEKTIRRSLKKLVDLGWLKREKLNAKKRRDQTYWYACGEIDPFSPVATGASARPQPDISSACSIKNISSPPAEPLDQGPAAPKPTAEKTKFEKPKPTYGRRMSELGAAAVAERKNWPPTLAELRNIPAETHKTEDDLPNRRKPKPAEAQQLQACVPQNCESTRSGILLNCNTPEPL